MTAPEEHPELGPPEGGEATIIRYPNRRLYDRSRGQYVTLQDVEEAVRRGVTVTVRDSKTGADLTRPVLAQILLERHPERMDVFPASFLHMALRANEAVLGVLRDHMRQSLAYAEMMRRAAPFGPLLAPPDWMRAFLPGLPSQDRQDDRPAALPAAPAAPAGTGGAVDALTRRIAELERRIDELQAAPADTRPGAAGKKRPGRAGRR